MSEKPLTISGRSVGPGEPTLIIAEIGVNHDGSLARALELVNVAAECRADAVKLQVFRADHLMHRSGHFAAYQSQQSQESDPTEMLRKYELPSHDLKTIVKAIRERGMMPLATPFSLTDIATLAEMDLPAVKIASPDLVNRPLLRQAARLDKPLLVSTGAATMAEVEQAVGWLREWGVPFALLHCISSYPTPNHAANLCWIRELVETFAVPIGYSDHTTELMSGALAVAHGACIVEKHLTYDRHAVGPDHAASADPKQFAEYVRGIRVADELRGQKGKHVLAIEEDVRQVSRQSLVLRRDLQRGDLLSAEDLIIQRPGTGIPAAMSDRVIGRATLRALEAGTLLQWDMISDAA